MRKISPEEREMLIVAENFGCVAEVIAELGITAEEAKEIIWGEDQERVGRPFFYFGVNFSRAAGGPAQPEFWHSSCIGNFANICSLSHGEVLNPESALHCVKAQKDCTKIKT